MQTDCRKRGEPDYRLYQKVGLLFVWESLINQQQHQQTKAAGESKPACSHGGERRCHELNCLRPSVPKWQWERVHLFCCKKPFGQDVFYSLFSFLFVCTECIQMRHLSSLCVIACNGAVIFYVVKWVKIIQFLLCWSSKQGSVYTLFSECGFKEARTCLLLLLHF